MDILIISHFTNFPSEKRNERFTYIANLLSQNEENTVEIVSSSVDHLNKKQKIKPVNYEYKYKFTVIDEPLYYKNVSFKRIFSHRKMAKNLSEYLKNREKPDVIYCAIPPLDDAKVAADYARKYNIPFIIDIQDLWPEAYEMVIKIPVIKDLLFFPLKYKADKIYKSANSIVAVSNTYLNRGISVNDKSEENICVFLGTDLREFDNNNNTNSIYKDKNEIWLIYIGTLGHSYNIPLIIDALCKIPQNDSSKIKFKILGKGPLSDKFKEYADSRVSFVDFMGWKSYSETVSYLMKSDIAINPIIRNSRASIINKHADYAAAGLPVINTQENVEYRKLLEEYKCGINCGVDSVEDVASALMRLIEDKELRMEMGRNSRRLAEEKFDRRKTYGEIIDVIKTIT